MAFRRLVPPSVRDTLLGIPSDTVSLRVLARFVCKCTLRISVWRGLFRAVCGGIFHLTQRGVWDNKMGPFFAIRERPKCTYQRSGMAYIRPPCVHRRLEPVRARPIGTTLRS